jgi:hypothetical protein
MKIPYYEKIHNDFVDGKISKIELEELCRKDEKLKKWIEHYSILGAAVKDLKKEGKI